MATIVDVANAAGVSVATVSRVLNKSGKVSPETVMNVKDAIERLNYVPNLSARNLRSRESHTIVAIAGNYTNPVYARIWSSMNEEAQKEGYTVITGTYDGDPAQAKSYCRMLENHQADGLILLNYTKADEWIQPYVDQYPIVQCCEFHPTLRAPRVVMDHFMTGYDSTAYLLSLGHKKIGFMSAENVHSSTIYRYDGYCKALQEKNIPINPDYKICADANYTFESGKRAALKMLLLPDRPTAIYCISDILALATILTATELGFRVPEDLSVMGCDNVDYTTMAHPFVTTIHLPFEMAARKAVNLLIKRIRDPKVGQDEAICIRGTLKARESTAQLKD